jgi:hypothetical protein
MTRVHRRARASALWIGHLADSENIVDHLLTFTDRRGVMVNRRCCRSRDGRLT